MRFSQKAAAVLGFVLSMSCVGEANEMGVWEKISNGLNETFVQSVTILGEDQLDILVGTNQGLYLSTDQQNFSQIFLFSGDNSRVNHIHFDQAAKSILAATDSGLYKSNDYGKKIDRVFYSSDPDENRCLSVYSSVSGIYLGTQRGLFYLRTGQSQWSKVFNQISQVPIYQILKDNQYLYFVTNKKVFRMQEHQDTPAEIFSEQPREVQESDNSAEVIREDRTINYVALAGQSEIIISADSGFSHSANHGQTWERFEFGAIPNKEINAILPVSPECSQGESPCLKFLTATNRGVFLFENGKWTSLYKGLPVNRVNSLGISEGRLVIAGTENGVYKIPLLEALTYVNSENTFEYPRIDYEEFKDQFNYEPSIEEIHRLAVDYAEVHPDKIKEWRAGAKNKAWFPSLDIGVDGGRGLTRNDSVFGSSSSGGSHYIGPDDKSSSEDLGWDVSLSWDLADVIWNSDQTTIDGRSKLMVELREDILNQVTRLYYERRRLQAELLAAGEDPRAAFDRKMRIDELTALIDGLTGGEFSLRIKERASQVSRGKKVKGGEDDRHVGD